MTLHDGPALHALCGTLGAWYPQSKNLASGGGDQQQQPPLCATDAFAFKSPYLKLAAEYGLGFRVDPRAAFGLQEILYRIKNESKSSFPVRRTLGLLDVARKDVIPTMIGAAANPHVFLEAIKVLKALSTPLESLIPGSSQASMLKVNGSTFANAQTLTGAHPFLGDDSSVEDAERANGGGGGGGGVPSSGPHSPATVAAASCPVVDGLAVFTSSCSPSVLSVSGDEDVVIDPGGASSPAGTSLGTPVSSFVEIESPVAVELSARLADIKLAFVDARSTKPLVDKLNSMFVQKRESGSGIPSASSSSSATTAGENTVRLSDGDRETIYQILMLLRNVLHLETREYTAPHTVEDPSRIQPDFVALVNRSAAASGLPPYYTALSGNNNVDNDNTNDNAEGEGDKSSSAAAAAAAKFVDSPVIVKPQNILLSNLFAQNFDRALLELLEHPDLPFWSGPLTEVISLLYKDQHVSTLQKLLSQWLESDCTDSTSDDESNTSPVESGDSPMFSSSNNASDSSDSDKRREERKRSRSEDRQSALTDQLENMQMSSNVSDSSTKSPRGTKHHHNHQRHLHHHPHEHSGGSIQLSSVPQGRKKRHRSPAKSNKRLRTQPGSCFGSNSGSSFGSFAAPSSSGFNQGCCEFIPNGGNGDGGKTEDPFVGSPPHSAPVVGAHHASLATAEMLEKAGSSSAREFGSFDGGLTRATSLAGQKQQQELLMDEDGKNERSRSMESLDSGAFCNSSGQSTPCVSRTGITGSTPDLFHCAKNSGNSNHLGDQQQRNRQHSSSSGSQESIPPSQHDAYTLQNHQQHRRQCQQQDQSATPQHWHAQQAPRRHQVEQQKQQQQGSSSGHGMLGILRPPPFQPPPLEMDQQQLPSSHVVVKPAPMQMMKRPNADSGQSGTSGNSSDEKAVPNAALSGVKPPISDSPSSTEEDLTKTRNALTNRRPPHHRGEGPSKKQQTAYKSANYAQLLSSRKKHRLAAQRRRTVDRNQSGSPYPTDDEISLLLRDFTVEFLVGGYGKLVGILANELPFSCYPPSGNTGTEVGSHNRGVEFPDPSTLRSSQGSAGIDRDTDGMCCYSPDANSNVDPAHFLWLVTYFLKFATQIPVDFVHLRSVLSPQVISFLVNQGLFLSEDARQTVRAGEKPAALTDARDSPPLLRRLHLVVAAVKEFLQSVDAYSRSSQVAESDKERIRTLQRFLLRLRDLRSLLSYLIRNELNLHPGDALGDQETRVLGQDPVRASPYLMDLILTNHMLLCTLPNFASSCYPAASDGISKSPHLPHPVTVTELMDHMENLATTGVMKQYGRVLATYTTNSPAVNDAVFTLFHHVVASLEKPEALFQPSILHTFADIWDGGYELCEEWSDVLAVVMKMFLDRVAAAGGSPTPGSESSFSLYDLNPQWKNAKAGFVVPRRASLTQPLGIVPENLEPVVMDLVSSCSEGLHWLEWAQSVLMQTACIKVYLCLQGSVALMSPEKRVLHERTEDERLSWDKEVELLLHPVLLYHCLARRRVPLVAWTESQEAALKNDKFLAVLDGLGLDLPAKTGNSFPLIPSAWSCDLLFEAAAKLAPATPSLVEVETVVRRATSSIGSNMDDSSDVGTSSTFENEVVTLRDKVRSREESKPKNVDSSWPAPPQRKDHAVLDKGFGPSTSNSACWTDAFSRVPAGGFVMDLDDDDDDD